LARPGDFSVPPRALLHPSGRNPGSAEIGYGFQFGGGWSLQPSGQITFITVDQGNYTERAYGLDIHPEDADSAIGRLGLQLQDTVYSAGGTAYTPYVNFNVLSEFEGDNKTKVSGTALVADLEGTWYDVGAGLTAAIVRQARSIRHRRLQVRRRRRCRRHGRRAHALVAASETSSPATIGALLVKSGVPPLFGLGFMPGSCAKVEVLARNSRVHAQT
jgi:hypothetical protein